MDEGIVYVATGDVYREQARLSATLSQRSTEYPMALVTDEDYSAEVFDRIIVNDSLKESYSAKPNGLLQSPFRKSVFVDCDAYIVEEISELFDLLDIFGFAAAVDPNEYALRVKGERNFDGLPESVPEYNTGVLAFDDGEASTELLKKWVDHYDEDHFTDQVSFRKALANTEIRFTALSPVYNCLVNWPMQITGTVKILHDTSNTVYYGGKDLDAIAEGVNRTEGIRVFLSDRGETHYPLNRFVDAVLKASIGPVKVLMRNEKHVSVFRKSVREVGLVETVRRGLVRAAEKLR